MSDSNRGAFLTGFVVGGLTGAIAALLMTPQSGDETRVQIYELKSRVEDVTTDLQERGKGFIEEKVPMAKKVPVPTDEIDLETDEEATEQKEI